MLGLRKKYYVEARVSLDSEEGFFYTIQKERGAKHDDLKKEALSRLEGLVKNGNFRGESNFVTVQAKYGKSNHPEAPRITTVVTIEAEVLGSIGEH